MAEGAIFRNSVTNRYAISEAVLDAEVRIGELMREVPKATKGNQYTGKMVSDSGVDNQKSKSAVIREAGFTSKKSSSRCEGESQLPTTKVAGLRRFIL